MQNVRHLPPPEAADEWDVPARDLDAERALLASAMTNADILDTLAGLPLPSTEFSDNRHHQLWAHLMRLRREGVPMELSAVGGELLRTGLIATVGGMNYLHDIAQYAVGPTSVPWYLAVVRDEARLARLDQLGIRTRQIARNHKPSEINDALAALRNELDDAAVTLDDGSDSTAHPWAPLDLTDVVEGKELNPPAQFLARDDGVSILYAGKIHAVSGESESAKTWLLLLGAAQVIGAGGTVLYLDFEDAPEGIVGRLRALGLSPELILQGLRYVRPDVPIDEVARSVISAVIEQGEVTLCIIDGVTEAMNLHGWNPLDNGDTAKFYNAVPRFVAKRGPAVALIDHVVKDQEKRGRYGLGAQHKLSGVDGAAYLVEVIRPFGVGQHGISRVRVAKDRPGRVREHAVGAVVGDLQLVSKDGAVHAELRSPRPYDGPALAQTPFRPTSVMERISRLLEFSPGLSKQAIETSIGGKREIARVALEMLEADGFIKAERGTRNSLTHRSVRPFREAPDA